MVSSPKKQLALDSNLLLDLAGEKDFAHEFREEFQRRGYAISRSYVVFKRPIPGRR